MADEVLIYDIETRQAHCLNLAAAKVWEQCNGQRTIEDLCILLHQNEEAIWLALAQLGERDLLVQPLIRPNEKPRLNRRQLMKAVGAAAVIALPVVSTIIAPTAAQASTCTASGNTCTLSAECCSGVCSIGVCA